MEKYNFKDNSDLKNNTAENLFDDSDIQACSATDCTGLIPALPQDEAEVEAYEDIYPYITKAQKTQKPDRKSTRLNSSHTDISRMPSSA